jgi:hypothetical protein
VDEVYPDTRRTALFTQCDPNLTHLPPERWLLRQSQAAASSLNAILGDKYTRVANQDWVVYLAYGSMVPQSSPPTIYTTRARSTVNWLLNDSQRRFVRPKAVLAGLRSARGDLRSKWLNN